MRSLTFVFFNRFVCTSLFFFIVLVDWRVVVGVAVPQAVGGALPFRSQEYVSCGKSLNRINWSTQASRAFYAASAISRFQGESWPMSC